MNLFKPLLSINKFFYSIGIKSRRLLPRQQSKTFGPVTELEQHRIEQIYVINLDSQPDRWVEMTRELSHLLDSSRAALTKRTTRCLAVDARNFTQLSLEGEDVVPFYTLGDQLFVEPQPDVLPNHLELDRPIRMSRPEIAVARSHISIWRRIAAGEHAYALVLEDDVWFHRGFTRHLDLAWEEMVGDAQRFDILYLSYREVKHGAQKTFLSRNIFQPVRGLWCLSGYVLTREGAAKLLALLPCRGPVDLWINHQFGVLAARAVSKSIISQRRDGGSTNSYSVLPALTKIGVLDYETVSLFQNRPREQPVFAFGSEGSGLSSLAMALSMLGYRCCSDLQDLPATELEHLLEGRPDRIFDAYVNIRPLQAKVQTLSERYPRAKFIITTSQGGDSGVNMMEAMKGVSARNVAILPVEAANKWKVVCEHLRCPPPVCPYPEIVDVGQRRLLDSNEEPSPVVAGKVSKRDRSPWVVESRRGWRGIRLVTAANHPTKMRNCVSFKSKFDNLDTDRWFLRDDTFTGNLALFRPSNVELWAGHGAVLSVKKESLGIRDYSAASISSRSRFLYGRFEVEMQATKVPGIVTGFFLHRDSPRQEIDIEIVGKRPENLLVNIFYNPGDEGASFDYGYRGSPSCIAIGVDASESLHRYAIEWNPDRIRWLVDDNLVHERNNWDPTPIPHLPMALHFNTWPTRSKELAGRLVDRRLPASSVIKAITVEANLAGS